MKKIVVKSNDLIAEKLIEDNSAANFILLVSTEGMWVIPTNLSESCEIFLLPQAITDITCEDYEPIS